MKGGKQKNSGGDQITEPTKAKGKVTKGDSRSRSYGAKGVSNAQKSKGGY